MEMNDSKIKIVKLLIARAEEQRQYNLENVTNKMEMPLGPLALLRINVNKRLDDFLKNKVIMEIINSVITVSSLIIQLFVVFVD